MSSDPATLSPAVRVRGLAKHFGAVHAVDGIDFDISKGSITALLGGNGAGKTTTIAMMLGLLMPTHGTIEIFGRDFSTARSALLQRMNFSSPYFDLPRKLTVRQNLSVYGRLYGVRDLKARIAALADELDLNEFIDRNFGALSAGQQTRVALAKSLVNEPDLLLMDEPTASLDPDTADRMRSYLLDHCGKTGMTVLLASHNMREVERMCDQVIMMRRGRVVAGGHPRELMAQYNRNDMEAVFLDIARDNAQAPADEGAVA